MLPEKFKHFESVRPGMVLSFFFACESGARRSTGVVCLRSYANGYFSSGSTRLTTHNYRAVLACNRESPNGHGSCSAVDTWLRLVMLQGFSGIQAPSRKNSIALVCLPSHRCARRHIMYRESNRGEADSEVDSLGQDTHMPRPCFILRFSIMNCSMLFVVPCRLSAHGFVSICMVYVGCVLERSRPRQSVGVT